MAAYEAAGETDEWFTPRYIFDALGENFDLDVAAPFSEISRAIHTFCSVARSMPEVRFLVTPVGTGLAGHEKAAVWRAFVDARIPTNCVLTSSWMHDFK